MFLSEWLEFPLAPCLAGRKGDLMTARVSMLLKLRASLTLFRACFLPGRAKDLSAPRYIGRLEGVWSITAMKGERKDCTDILHSQYHLTTHVSQFHHPQNEDSTILRNVGTLNNYTVQKSKNNATIRTTAALRT